MEQSREAMHGDPPLGRKEFTAQPVHTKQAGERPAHHDADVDERDGKPQWVRNNPTPSKHARSVMANWTTALAGGDTG